MKPVLSLAVALLATSAYAQSVTWKPPSELRHVELTGGEIDDVDTFVEVTGFPEQTATLKYFVAPTSGISPEDPGGPVILAAMVAGTVENVRNGETKQKIFFWSHDTVWGPAGVPLNKIGVQFHSELGYWVMVSLYEDNEFIDNTGWKWIPHPQ